jgi:tetratricopeptide (TPR) repeat protein
LKLTGDWQLGNGNLSLAFLAGFVSILVTNFFGFSVVPIQLEFFLFPAIVIAIANDQPTIPSNQLKKLNGIQKFILLIVVGCGLIVVFAAGKYWYADTLYASGKAYNSINQPDVATKYLSKAINLEPNQPVYYGDPQGLATSYARLALALSQQKQTDQATQFSNLAITEINKAVSLSPANVNLKRVQFSIFIILSTINPDYLVNARDALVAAVAEAPTDAKLFYNLGLVYARTGQTDLALSTLKKTVDLKANYKDARLAYAYLLINNKRYNEAKVQLNYILANIDPTDSLSKQALESIK